MKTNNPSANEILVDCGNEKHCTVEALQNLAKKENPEIILATIDDLLSAYQEQGIYCHQQAHHIGKFVFDYFGNLSQALSYIDRRCGGALYHEIFASYIESKVFFNDVSAIDIEISEICSEFEDSSYGIRWECAHGLGHGLLRVYDYVVSSAMKHCDQLEEKREQTACYDGVSMENVDENKQTKGGDFEVNDILYPCNKLEGKYASSCYYYHASYIFLKKNHSIDESFKMCDKIELEKSAKSCYLGLVKILISSDNQKNMLLVCKSVRHEYQKDCIQLVTSFILDQKSTDEALEFCKIVPKEFKMDCYDGLGKGVLVYYPKDVENVCSKVEVNYYQVCKDGIPKKFDCTITYELDGKSITEEQECLLK